MRVGIFGGSFDPIHLGHLILAEQCREQARLDKLLFIPAPRPPHKRNSNIASFDQRVQMLSLALQDSPQFSIDTCEQDRPGLSFTVDTLRYLHQREPSNEWYLILGADSVRDLVTWRDPQEIAKLSTLLIVQRPGVSARPPEYFRYQEIRSPLIDISSTNIRDRAGQKSSIHFLVPPLVEVYIQQQSLYRLTEA